MYSFSFARTRIAFLGRFSLLRWRRRGQPAIANIPAEASASSTSGLAARAAAAAGLATLAAASHDDRNLRLRHRNRQRSTASCDGSSNVDERLRRWLQQYGGGLNEAVAVQEVHGAGFGLVCVGGRATGGNCRERHLPPGTVLLTVPWALVITPELARADPTVQRHLVSKTDAEEVSDTASFAIRLWLLQHAADSGSPWVPWLDSLPRGLGAGSPALPLALAEDERLLRAALGGTALAADARRLRAQLLRELDTLRDSDG
eukprot:TRINITY_DN23607_c0_g1_i2.p1 TRINITY_DN23607_c0_g1~~TRINITY_DN23607_c0_g1_i2.p1  ORF type:complete len:260 (+),score=48.15 TRINITY_DN23607_c0_g1_i2:2-781(+)